MLKKTLLFLFVITALLTFVVVAQDHTVPDDGTVVGEVGTKIKNPFICRTEEGPDGSIRYACERDCPPGNTTCTTVSCGFYQPCPPSNGASNSDG